MKSFKDLKCGRIIHNVDIKKVKNSQFFLVRFPSRRVLSYIEHKVELKCLHINYSYKIHDKNTAYRRH